MQSREAGPTCSKSPASIPFFTLITILFLLSPFVYGYLHIQVQTRGIAKVGFHYFQYYDIYIGYTSSPPQPAPPTGPRILVSINMSDQTSTSTTTSLHSPAVSTSLPPTFLLPSYTPYGAPKTNQPQSSAVLNYYFLLIAVFVIIIIIAYYSLVRRRRQKQAHYRSDGQSALARDLETWPGPRRRARREEGLDERGEPPPPYVPKELEAAVIRGEAVELSQRGRQARKPPDYQEART